MKVSVIVPVYGVEEFVGRAVESMMLQTLKDVEYIFIDDCTPDNSMHIVREVVARYPDRAANVKILTHNENRGLPAARNTGLAAATGKYIFHWDSDDYAAPEMLEDMFAFAEKNGADFVWADWFLTFGSGSRLMRERSVPSPAEALTMTLAGEMKYNVWNKLIVRDLYTQIDIIFPEGRAMGEDMTIIKLLAVAHRVNHLAKAYYHYVRTNADALTKQYSVAHLEQLRANTSDICSYLSGKATERELAWFKLNVKLPFLFTGRRSDISLWKSWYPEADRYIMTNGYQAPRTRLLQWCAAHGLSLVNMAYNMIIHKIIYGVIYR